MCAAYDASQLASGKPAVRDYASPTCGWAARRTKAPILSVAKRSLSSESHVAWKRELGLGAYGGMVCRRRSTGAARSSCATAPRACA